MDSLWLPSEDEASALEFQFYQIPNSDMYVKQKPLKHVAGKISAPTSYI